MDQLVSMVIISLLTSRLAIAGLTDSDNAQQSSSISPHETTEPELEQSFPRYRTHRLSFKATKTASGQSQQVASESNLPDSSPHETIVPESEQSQQVTSESTHPPQVMVESNRVGGSPHKTAKPESDQSQGEKKYSHSGLRSPYRHFDISSYDLLKHIPKDSKHFYSNYGKETLEYDRRDRRRFQALMHSLSFPPNLMLPSGRTTVLKEVLFPASPDVIPSSIWNVYVSRSSRKHLDTFRSIQDLLHVCSVEAQIYITSVWVFGNSIQVWIEAFLKKVRSSTSSSTERYEAMRAKLDAFLSKIFIGSWQMENMALTSVSMLKNQKETKIETIQDVGDSIEKFYLDLSEAITDFKSDIRKLGYSHISMPSASKLLELVRLFRDDAKILMELIIKALKDNPEGGRLGQLFSSAKKTIEKAVERLDLEMAINK
ncbi:hypothetical protein BDEG_27178 [Batrachochytrium dendrobatidis JEL423]|uniref:Uncharacterized protein n=1 Tax=Batrachochytrium dendrobatidis (strain JEL423) TaxID=403673 RepID=A0A177WW55_BATDL|nr:hypothetical protein BDEG_27178 [Batrachochytrium dendrobatidis JEL423]